MLRRRVAQAQPPVLAKHPWCSVASAVTATGTGFHTRETSGASVRVDLCEGAPLHAGTQMLDSVVTAPRRWWLDALLGSGGGGKKPGSSSSNAPPAAGGQPNGKKGAADNKKDSTGGGGGGGGETPEADPVDEITPRIRIFVAGMFLVSFVLYKMALPRGRHVGWHTVQEAFAGNKLQTIDIYDSYAEFSTDSGYLHVGLVGDQHTNIKIKALQAGKDRAMAEKLAAADPAQQQALAKDAAAADPTSGSLPPLAYCGTPASEQCLAAFGVFAWIVPFVFFPTVALILTRAIGTAMAVSAGAESKGKLLKKEFIVHTTSNTRFAHVAGMKEAKREVTEIVEFLKNPVKYTRLGAKIPTGALLMGPPGTGKTLLAKAVAGEAGIGFIPVCGSDFVELYVGMGALRVRQLFEVAKQQRCIVYIDEIDAIGLKRQGSGNGEKAEQEHTLNELLTQLDGFSSNRGEIMILASTNVAREMLDPALIRPGRFDRLVHVDSPVISERIDIFKVHLSNLTLVAPPVDAAAAEEQGAAVAASPSDASAAATAAATTTATPTSETTTPVTAEASNGQPTADAAAAPPAAAAAPVASVAFPFERFIFGTLRRLLEHVHNVQPAWRSDSAETSPVNLCLTSLLPLLEVLVKGSGNAVANRSPKQKPTFDEELSTQLSRALLAREAATPKDSTTATDAWKPANDLFDALMGNLAILDDMVPLFVGKLPDSDGPFRTLKVTTDAIRTALLEILACPGSGVTAADWLPVVQQQLQQRVNHAVARITAKSAALHPTKDAPKPKKDGGDDGAAPVGPYAQQLALIRKCATGFNNTVVSIRLPAAPTAATTVEAVTAAGVVNPTTAAAPDAAASSADRYALALLGVFVDQSVQLVDIELSLMAATSLTAAVAATTSTDAEQANFKQALLALGAIVLQPAGYELLAPVPPPPTSASEPASTSTVGNLGSDPDKKILSSLEQAYEFDFTSTLAKKTPEERRIIDTFAKRMSEMCPGFVGADIANVCNEGAILAAREQATCVTISHLERSIDRVLAGIEHRSRKLSDFEKNVVAHHEAGHAVAGWFLNLADPLMKVSIVPRGGSALGYAQYLPNENHLRSANEILDSICVTLGGRVAEEIFFGHLSTGASDDLSKVTKSAYHYVSSFTASTVRPSPTSDQSKVMKPFGANMSNTLDEKAKELVDSLYARTYALLLSRKAEMEVLAKHLLEHEVLTHQDVIRLIGVRQERSASDRKKAA